MIKHIVLWTFHEHANGRSKSENIVLAINSLNALKNKIPSIVTLETGTNITSGNESFDLALFCEFNDPSGLNEYQNHPEHLKVVQFLRKVRDKRAVVDYITNN